MQRYQVGDYVWVKRKNDPEKLRGRIGRLTEISTENKIGWVQFGRKKPEIFSFEMIKPYIEEEK